MRRFLVPVALLAFAAAGCGGSLDRTASRPPNAPSVAALVRQSAHGQPGKRSAHYELDAKFDLRLKGLGAAILGGQPITLHLSGDASRSAATAAGNLSIGASRLEGKLIADSKALYVNVLGAWYGSRLDKLHRYARSRGSSTMPAIDAHAEELVDGAVADGPTLDGVDTWELAGTLDADALADVVRQAAPERITGIPPGIVEVIAGATSFTVDVGKDDRLLRRAELEFDLSPQRIKRLGGDDELESAKLSFTLDLSRWGERVQVSPPGDYKPLAGLLRRFRGGGGLFGLPGV